MPGPVHISGSGGSGAVPPASPEPFRSGRALDPSEGPLLWAYRQYTAAQATNNRLLIESPELDPGIYSVALVIAAGTPATAPVNFLDLEAPYSGRENGDFQGPEPERIKYVIAGGFLETQPVRFSVDPARARGSVKVFLAGPSWAGVQAIGITLILEKHKNL